MEALKFEIFQTEFEEPDMNFKVIVLGDASVGKSSLTLKAIKDQFQLDLKSTVGFEFLTFNIKIENSLVKLQIWDTCGQEAYRSLITNFYRNSDVAILVYSIDDLPSFEHLEEWLKEITSYAHDTKLVLVGNKVDLEERRSVSQAKALKFKEENKLDFFVETSARNGLNARNVFIDIAKILYQNEIKHLESLNKKKNDDLMKLSNLNEEIVKKNVGLENTNKKENKNKCLC